MKAKTTFLFFFGWIFCNTTFSAPKIILKLDDLQAKNATCPSIPTMDYLVDKQVKAGFGAVAIKFDSTALKVLTPYLNAKNRKGEKLFEIWNHGLDHVKPEFSGTTYEYQKSHFKQANQLIKKHLGIQMHSFGTPYNASDSTTNKVILEDPNYNVFMYSTVKPYVSKGIIYLDQRVNMENGTGNPDFEFFVTNYKKLKITHTDYMILQGHPNIWTTEKLYQFKKIIDFLIAEGCEFVLPYEYYQRLNLSLPLIITDKKASKR